jgi:ABC-type nickel/cobalt efflux system permease component RcnA
LLFSTLFDKAIRDKEDVRIISNQLLRRFYNKLTTQLQKVLENGNTVSIIVPFQLG